MVETGGLENRFTLTGNGGSNPSPSAMNLFHDIQGHPSAADNPQVNAGVFVFLRPKRHYGSHVFLRVLLRVHPVETAGTLPMVTYK